LSLNSINHPAEGGCGHQDASGLDAQLAKALGLHFPEAHFDASALAVLASAIRKKTEARLTALPFCCTIEAEALGAKINLGNSEIGPRPGDFIKNSLDEFMAGPVELNFQTGRISAIIKACEHLRSQGEKVLVEISGPLSILTGLMDLTKVIKGWRKNESLTALAFNRLGAEIIRYALELKKAGATIISYADPVGAPKIIGPKYARFLAEAFLVPFLEKLRRELQGSTVHVCPHSARLLIDAGLAEWRPVALSGPVTYQDGCLEANGRAEFLGQACIKRRKHVLDDGVIRELRLIKPARTGSVY
jgi:uroporphyrinogen-III decarboxylase